MINKKNLESWLGPRKGFLISQEKFSFLFFNYFLVGFGGGASNLLKTFWKCFSLMVLQNEVSILAYERLPNKHKFYKNYIHPKCTRMKNISDLHIYTYSANVLTLGATSSRLVMVPPFVNCLIFFSTLHKLSVDRKTKSNPWKWRLQRIKNAEYWRKQLSYFSMTIK